MTTLTGEIGMAGDWESPGGRPEPLRRPLAPLGDPANAAWFGNGTERFMTIWDRETHSSHRVFQPV